MGSPSPGLLWQPGFRQGTKNVKTDPKLELSELVPPGIASGAREGRAPFAERALRLSHIPKPIPFSYTHNKPA